MSEPNNPFLGSHPRAPRRGTSVIFHTILTSAPERITGVERDGRAFNVYGQKDQATPPTANDGNVWFGWSATNVPTIVYPGLATVSKADPGYIKDLSGFWVQGTPGDGVLVEWDDGFLPEE